MESILFEIAETVFELSSDRPLASLRSGWPGEVYVNAKQPEIVLKLHYCASLRKFSVANADLVFDSGTYWLCYRTPDSVVYEYAAPGQERPYRILSFDHDFTTGKILINTEHLREGGNVPMSPALDSHPAQLIMVNVLSRCRGLMVHACGIDHAGKGYLCLGGSSHGKTTMSLLWERNARILNDERIVLRFRSGRLWMYGTPWHGEYHGISMPGVPVEKIFFLRHSNKNRATRLQNSIAACMMLSCSLAPWWDAEGMKFSAAFCERAIAQVPCFDLGFTPDNGVVDYMRCVK